LSSSLEETLTGVEISNLFSEVDIQEYESLDLAEEIGDFFVSFGSNLKSEFVATIDKMQLAVN